MTKACCGKCGWQIKLICRNAKSGRSDTPVNKHTQPCKEYRESGK